MSCEGCLNKAECEHIEKMCGYNEKHFHVGQIVTLEGRLFKIKSVKPNEIRLKLWRKTTNTGGSTS